MKQAENQIHDWLRSFSKSRSIRVGIGDDAAVVTWKRDGLLFKVDMTVEGVHFAKGTPPEQIGRKALYRTISDCAAMGGRPRFALAAIAAPKNWGGRLRGILRGIRDGGRPFGVLLIGGDLSRTQGPCVVSITLWGTLDGRRPLLRSDARSGDAIFVTGSLGGSLLGKHLRFRPRVAEGIRLASRYRVGGMMDLSDGLAIDLPRLCRASGVGARVDLAKVPISSAARRLATRTGKAPWRHAIGDGEDYELLFTLRPRERQRLHKDPGFGSTRFYEIGRIVARRGVRWVAKDGREKRLSREGYEHRWV